MSTATTQSRSKKKTKRKVTRVPKKQFSTSEVDDLLAKEREKAHKQALLDLQSGQLTGEFADDEPAFTGEEVEPEGDGVLGSIFPGQRPDIQGDDIFAKISRNYPDVPVFYQVKQNGQYIGEFWHPDCSWQLLKETYGGGLFFVQAKNDNNKQIITQQTLRIAGPPIIASKKEKDDTPPPYVPPVPQQLDPNALIQFMQAANETARKDNRRDDVDDRRNQTENISSFNNLMLQQQKSTQDMFMMIQKQTTDMIREINSNTTKLIEKQDDKFTKIVERLAEASKPKEEFGTIKLIEMLNKAEESGWKRMQSVVELADAKAEVSTELALAGREEEGTGTMGNLIKAIVPLITQAGTVVAQPHPMQNQRPPQQMMPPQGVPLQRPMPPQGVPLQGAPQNRVAPGMIYPPQPRRAVHSPVVPPGQGATTPGARRAPPRTVNPTKTEERSPVDASRQVPPQKIQMNSLGLPTISDKSSSASADDTSVDGASAVLIPKSELTDEPALKAKQAGAKLEQTFDSATPLQRNIATIAIPKIAEFINDLSLSPQDAAAMTLGVLEQKNYPPQVVAKNFAFDFMLQIAGQFGIGAEKRPWLEEFYAHIANTAGVANSQTEPSLG